MVRTSSAWQLMLSGERGIWTLAPVLPTYSLSRGAPSASLGISPGRYLQSKFLNNITFYIWFQAQILLIFPDLRSGEDGIRTHVPVRTNGFQDRRVMTTSLPLQNGGAAPFRLGSHLLFSREQMIYYQMTLSLSMLIFNYFQLLFSEPRQAFSSQLWPAQLAAIPRGFCTKKSFLGSAASLFLTSPLCTHPLGNE